jgi:protein-S-isoprenylcysteine O-methyltransferase Ste14
MNQRNTPEMNDEGPSAGRGGSWVLAQYALMIALLVSGPALGAYDNSPQWARAAGIMFLAVGAWIGVAGMRELGGIRTVFPKPLKDSHLVQTGVYGIVRHPLYASLIWLGFGWGLVFFSKITLGLAMALTLLLIGKTAREEAWLREKFPEYADYAKRVRRFLPF